jgi:hypothetical protein
MRFLLIGAFIGLWASAAQACDGQKGKVLYEDTFADGSGGWPSYQGFTVKAPGAEVSGVGAGRGTRIVNQTFFFNQADYCLEVEFPPNDSNAVEYLAGIRFLSSADSNEYYLAALTNSGMVKLSRSNSSTDFVNLWSIDQKSIGKWTSGSSNSIEAIVNGSTISVLLNGKVVKTIRARIPNGDFRFGIDLEVYKNPGVFKIKSVKVTEVQ